MKKIIFPFLLLILFAIFHSCDREYDFTGTNTEAVTTVEILNIAKNTATVNSKLNTLNGSTLVQRGVCYATTSNPTTSSYKQIDNTGNDIGSFSITLLNLKADTKYFVRAFATTAQGTAYGKELSFTTLKPTLASITTIPINNITASSAYSGGNITDNGGATVTERGIVFSSVNTVPTLSDTKRTSGSGSGSYSLQINGLSSGQQYYVRAYAITTAGVSYGNVVSFRTLSIPQNVLTTDVIINSSNFSATVYGSVGSDGGAVISSRGFVYSTTLANPVLGSAQSFSVSGTVGSFSGTLSSIQPGTTYYVRAYATNAYGTAYGIVKTFKIDLAVGQTYGGGKIAYLLQSGDPGYILGEQHGIIIPAYPTSSTYQWGCYGTNISTSTGFGTGNSNTVNISGLCGSYTAGGYAYYLSSGGYSDWYLPSYSELLKVLANRSILGLSYSYYWTSSQSSSTTAYALSLNGSLSSFSKTSYLNVLPIRKF